MAIEKDFEELLKYFNKHQVKYCIVGAFAVGFHVRPRYTKDTDILVEPTLQNGERIITAIKDFGFESLELTKEDFEKPGQIIQMGQEPVRIDLINAIPGCSFEEIWENKQIGEYGSEKVYFIGFKELLKNKQERPNTSLNLLQIDREKFVLQFLLKQNLGRRLIGDSIFLVFSSIGRIEQNYKLSRQAKAAPRPIPQCLALLKEFFARKEVASVEPVPKKESKSPVGEAIPLGE